MPRLLASSLADTLSLRSLPPGSEGRVPVSAPPSPDHRQDADATLLRAAPMLSAPPRSLRGHQTRVGALRVPPLEDPVHIRDFDATILHLPGIDHARFTFRFRGLQQRLTGVEEAHVVRGILA